MWPNWFSTTCITVWTADTSRILAGQARLAFSYCIENIRINFCFLDTGRAVVGIVSEHLVCPMFFASPIDGTNLVDFRALNLLRIHFQHMAVYVVVWCQSSIIYVNINIINEQDIFVIKQTSSFTVDVWTLLLIWMIIIMMTFGARHRFTFASHSCRLSSFLFLIMFLMTWSLLISPLLSLVNLARILHGLGHCFISPEDVYYVWIRDYHEHEG